MSSIIFPAPMVFKYDEEMPIVVLLMVLYAIPCAVCTIAFQYHNGSYSAWVTKFVYCFGIINQCLNPLLPVVLTVGDVQAVRRLKVPTCTPTWTPYPTSCYPALPCLFPPPSPLATCRAHGGRCSGCAPAQGTHLHPYLRPQPHPILPSLPPHLSLLHPPSPSPRLQHLFRG